MLRFKVHLSCLLCVDCLAGIGRTEGLSEVDQGLTETDVAHLTILYLLLRVVVENLQVLLWGVCVLWGGGGGRGVQVVQH